VILLLVVFSASLAIDLQNHLRLSSFLHKTQPHPKDAFDVMTNIHKPEPIGYRRTASLSVLGSTTQSFRYTSLVYRQPYVLSPLVAAYPPTTAPYPHSVNQTAEVIKLRRWNSFFLLHHYFQVINSDIPPLALEEMFCVGKPLFQFKQGVVAISDDKLSPLLNRLGSETSVQLLEKCVVVNPEDIDDSLAEFEVAGERLIHVTSDEEADQKLSNAFSCSVKEYEYDSFSIDVVTDKDGILYWSDGFDEGWHAYIDGQEIPIYRANINFKALILPKGSNHIQFVYEHMFFNIGVASFLGTFGLALMLALITRLFSNKRVIS
jgi:hypothetical protein